MDCTKNYKNVCRVCLEEASKLYPLEGYIANVDVPISTMILYCTSVKVETGENLPKGVCIPCFKIIRIAYNFIHQFRENNKQFMEQCTKEEPPDENNISEVEEHIEEEEENHGEESHIQELVENNNSTSTIIQMENEDVTDKEEFDKELVEVIESIPADLETEKHLYQDHRKVIIEDLEEYIKNGTVTIIPEDELHLLENVADSNGDDTGDVKYVEVYNDHNRSGLYIKTEDESLLENSDSNIKQQPNITLRRKYIKQFICPHCPNQKFTEHQFMYHIPLHQNDKFVCNICSTSDEMSASVFLQHFERFHRYECPFCRMRFNRKGTLYAHMKKHTGIKYVCSINKCQKSFLTTWSLKKHQNTHSDTTKYSCGRCNVSFKTYDTYRYHLKTHNGRNYLCTFCGKTYLQSVHLKYHLWNHTGVKQFNCDFCTKSYTSVTQLKKHKRRHHPNEK